MDTGANGQAPETMCVCGGCIYQNWLIVISKSVIRNNIVDAAIVRQNRQNGPGKQAAFNDLLSVRGHSQIT